MHSGRPRRVKSGLEQIIKTRVERRHKEMGFHIFSSKRLQRFKRIPNAFSVWEVSEMQKPFGFWDFTNTACQSRKNDNDKRKGGGTCEKERIYRENHERRRAGGESAGCPKQQKRQCYRKTGQRLENRQVNAQDAEKPERSTTEWISTTAQYLDSEKQAKN